MTELTGSLTRLLREDFETDFRLVMAQMPKPPEGATPEQLIRHTGLIFHRLAFMKGMAVGTEASQAYPE